MDKPPEHKNILVKNLSNRLCLKLATLLGVGYLPLFPGSWGSLAGLGVFFLIRNKIYFFVIALLSLIISLLITSQAEKLLGEKDSKRIVIDDFSGMLISFLFIPYSIKWAIAGFLIFRFLDTIKIFPANKLEKYAGARGVVGDDLVAGVYTNISLHILRILFK